jgi:hypothetical protein
LLCFSGFCMRIPAGCGQTADGCMRMLLLL